MKRKNLRLFTIAMLCVAFAAGSAMAGEKKLNWKTDSKKIEMKGRVVNLSPRVLTVQPLKDGEEKKFRFSKESARWESVMPCEVSDIKTGYWGTVRGTISADGSTIEAEQINTRAKKRKDAKPKASEKMLRGTLTVKDGKVYVQAGDVAKALVRMGEDTPIFFSEILKREDIKEGDEITVYGRELGDERLADRVIRTAKAPKPEEEKCEEEHEEGEKDED